jgi:chromosome segregation ATPase
MRRLHIAMVSGLGVALVAAGGVIIHQARELAEVRRQMDSAVLSLHETQDALQQSELRAAEALSQSPKPSTNGKAVIAQRNATIKQLTAELNAAQSSNTDLQKKLATSQDENEKALAAASKNYDTRAAELQARLDKLQKELSDAQSDLESSRQRVAALQKANDQLSSANNAGTARLAEREHILNSLQDLDRRRETYLTSIADRYRNLTSQFRTMSGMMNSNRGQDSNAFSGPALDLIQNAISLTDTDLQHLSELSAKAYRLEKQLAKK